MSISYLCLGAYTGMAMNLFCIIRNIIYCKKDVFKWKYTPLVCSVIVMLIGILTADTIWSVLVIIGLTVNTYCISFDNSQHFRISILITSPFSLVYNIIVFSIGGVLLETITILSSAIGLIRNRKKL